MLMLPPLQLSHLKAVTLPIELAAPTVPDENDPLNVSLHVIALAPPLSLNVTNVEVDVMAPPLLIAMLVTVAPAAFAPATTATTASAMVTRTFRYVDMMMPPERVVCPDAPQRVPAAPLVSDPRVTTRQRSGFSRRKRCGTAVECVARSPSAVPPP